MAHGPHSPRLHCRPGWEEWAVTGTQPECCAAFICLLPKLLAHWSWLRSHSSSPGLGRMQTDFFFFFARKLHECPSHSISNRYLFPLWSFMSQAFTVNLPQHPGFPNSHHHGLLRYAFSSLMPQTPAANQFQSHGRVYHGNSPTYCYQFSVLVIFPIAYKSNSKKERFISAPG